MDEQFEQDEVQNDYEQDDENVEFQPRKPFKQRIKDAWGNLRSVVTFAGAVVLWIVAAIFFWAQKSVGVNAETTATLSLCNIMMGICIGIAVIMAAFCITSIVLFVKQNKKTESENSAESNSEDKA